MGMRWTVLVGVEKMSGATMATALPEKGGGDKFMLDKCLECLEENGDKENSVVVKSDQEPAIRSLVQGIIGFRPEGRTIPEEAPNKKSCE